MTTSNNVNVFFTITDYQQDLSEVYQAIEDVFEKMKRELLEVFAVKEVQWYYKGDEE